MDDRIYKDGIVFNNPIYRNDEIFEVKVTHVSDPIGSLTIPKDSSKEEIFEKKIQLYLDEDYLVHYSDMELWHTIACSVIEEWSHQKLNKDFLESYKPLVRYGVKS